jgi:hypothetical protein
MRRPCLASSSKRNRKRLLRNSPGKQTCGRLCRRLSPRLPVDMRVGRPEAALSAPQISTAAEAPNSAAAEVAACEPMRCGFGAVRVGALLGRLRLHLQTERFLAVHRGDILWERGCVGGALALAVIAAGMQEEELDAPLATALSAARSRSGGTLRRTTTANLRGEESEFGGGRPRCTAGLQPLISACRDVNAALIPRPNGSGQEGSATLIQTRRDAAVAQNPQGRHKSARPGLQRPICPSEYAFRAGRAEQVSDVCNARLERGTR